MLIDHRKDEDNSLKNLNENSILKTTNKTVKIDWGREEEEQKQ